MEGMPTAQMAAGGVPTLSGRVKSFNGAKGYGFITAEGMPGDVMFSKRELPEDTKEVQGNFLNNRAVTFEYVEGPDGRMKATSVHIALEEGQNAAGRIKSYSDRNGYGFITSSMLDDDVRFMRMDVPSNVQPGLNLVGALVTFQLKSRPDGKLMASHVQFQSNPTKNFQFMNQGQGFGGHQGMGGMMGGMGGGGMGGGGMGGGGMGGGGMGGGGMGGGGMGGGGMGASGGQPATGVVKSFSEKNGYGFITVPGHQGDVKFGFKDCTAGPVEPGTQVSFSMIVFPDGRAQAKNVASAGFGGAKRPAGGQTFGMAPQNFQQNDAKRMRPNNGMNGGGMQGGGMAVSTKTGQWIVGTIKSYNSMKGFGFISTPDVPSDVYFNGQMLPPQAQTNNLIGTTVTCELATAPDGKIRAVSINLA